MNQITIARQNRLTIAIVVVLALGASAFNGSASAAGNAGTTFAVSVVVPIAIAKAADFNFGSFYPGSTAGTVDVNGRRSVSGGVFTASSGAAPTAVKFDVTGGASTTYTVTCPTSVILTGPGAPMALTRIGDPTFDDAGGSPTLATAGTQSIYLGGSVAVAANQAAGVYTGNLTATVTYN